MAIKRVQNLSRFILPLTKLALCAPKTHIYLLLAEGHDVKGLLSNNSATDNRRGLRHPI